MTNGYPYLTKDSFNFFFKYFWIRIYSTIYILTFFKLTRYLFPFSMISCRLFILEGFLFYVRSNKTVPGMCTEFGISLLCQGVCTCLSLSDIDLSHLLRALPLFLLISSGNFNSVIRLINIQYFCLLYTSPSPRDRG